MLSALYHNAQILEDVLDPCIGPVGSLQMQVWVKKYVCLAGFVCMLLTYSQAVFDQEKYQPAQVKTGDGCL